MKREKITKRDRLFVGALCLAGLASSSALADSINFQQVQALTFPTIALSGSGNVNLTVSPLNSSTSGTGQVIGGTASRGQYALSLVQAGGGKSVSLSLDVSGANTGNAGLTLDSFRGLYNGSSIASFPSSTLPLPAKHPANTPLYLGATITAAPSVAAGTYNASFSITIFIQ